MLGRPEFFLQKPTASSRALLWFAWSHERKWAAVWKNSIFMTNSAKQFNPGTNLAGLVNFPSRTLVPLWSSNLDPDQMHVDKPALWSNTPLQASSWSEFVSQWLIART
jgi:hypothetical protein